MGFVWMERQRQIRAAWRRAQEGEVGGGGGVGENWRAWKVNIRYYFLTLDFVSLFIATKWNEGWCVFPTSIVFLYKYDKFMLCYQSHSISSLYFSIESDLIRESFCFPLTISKGILFTMIVVLLWKVCVTGANVCVYLECLSEFT